MKSTFCIDSVASFNDINKASTNNSKTKQTFSFSKSQRFCPIKPLCQRSTYGGDYIAHKTQGTGIGYGKRSDFTKCSNIAPPSTKYQRRSEFEENQIKKRGKSLALNRDQVKFNQYIPKQAQLVPPSTFYEYEKVNNKFNRSPSFSVRSRTKMMDRSMTIDPETSNPGPGNYERIQSSRASRFSNIQYGTNKSKRFESADNKVPGSGYYNAELYLSNNGKYSNSKYKGGTQAKFSRTSRATFIDETKNNIKNMPGPGFYKTPSEFGQYDGNVYGASALSRFTQKHR